MSHTAEKKRKVQPKIGSIFAAVTCAEMDSVQKRTARLADAAARACTVRRGGGRGRDCVRHGR